MTITTIAVTAVEKGVDGRSACVGLTAEVGPDEDWRQVRIDLSQEAHRSALQDLLAQGEDPGLVAGRLRTLAAMTARQVAALARKQQGGDAPGDTAQPPDILGDIE